MMNETQALSIAVAEDSPGVRVAEALAFSFLIGLSAQARIYLPFTPVPITGQTLAVLAGGAMLGSGYGTLAVAFYLAEGILGLPFFAGGGWGARHLFGPTAGYLLGFLPAASLTGILAERGWSRTPAKAAAAACLGAIVVFACGLAGLSAYLPAGRLLPAGLWPFVPGEAVKILCLAGLLPAWRAAADGMRGR